MPPLPDLEMTKAATDGGPFVLKNLVPTLWMIGIAAAGGVVSFYQKVKAGRSRPFNFAELIGEMLVSAFVGLITYWLCKAYGVGEYWTAAGVAISGHMGARLLFIVEQIIEKRAKP